MSREITLYDERARGVLVGLGMARSVAMMSYEEVSLPVMHVRSIPSVKCVS